MSSRYQLWSTYEGWAKGRKRQRSIENELVFYRQFWRWYGEKRDHNGIDSGVVAEWKRHLETTPSKLGRPRSPHSVNDMLGAMATIWFRLMRLGVVTENPFAVASVPRTETPRRRPKYLKREEVDLLLAAAREYGRDIHLFVALGVFAGLRKGEIDNLRWRDIDMERTDTAGNRVGCIYVWGDEGHKVKTETSERVVPLHPELASVLAGYQDDPDRYVVKPWLTSRGVGGYRWDCRASFKVVTAGLDKRVTPHMLRHTFASLLVSKGVSLKKVSTWLGHTSVTTTEIYAHVAPVDAEVGKI